MHVTSIRPTPDPTRPSASASGARVVMAVTAALLVAVAVAGALAGPGAATAPGDPADSRPATVLDYPLGFSPVAATTVVDVDGRTVSRQELAAADGRRLRVDVLTTDDPVAAVAALSGAAAELGADGTIRSQPSEAVAAGAAHGDQVVVVVGTGGVDAATVDGIVGAYRSF